MYSFTSALQQVQCLVALSRQDSATCKHSDACMYASLLRLNTCRRTARLITGCRRMTMR